MNTWIRQTVAEPLPVLYGHADYRKGDGPFYACNSESFKLYSEKALVRVRASAQRLSADGFTVTVDLVER